MIVLFFCCMKGFDIENFNTCVAYVRVVNEHTISVLRGRWSSLRELRKQIRSKANLERIVLWFTTCVVLHNMLISFANEWTADDQSDSDCVLSEESDVESDSDDDNVTGAERVELRQVPRAAKAAIACLKLEGLHAAHLRIFAGWLDVIDPTLLGAVEKTAAVAVPPEPLTSLFNGATDQKILIPVNCNGKFWYAIVVDLEKNPIKYYDSMKSSYALTLRALAHRLMPHLPETQGRYRVNP
ncbi:unnamed protein product [Phytophthora lilii]|uniref:Unnamed protein product n=1 Tax=Phytophthora lilii TaxID=2077276 RepID=A0A9W6TH25_9STRA|nr:unnamed protein product [Phytophthora lilii]